MDPNRRNVLGILAAGAAVACVTEGQASQSAAPNSVPLNADGAVQAARQGLQRDAQRIAMVNLPQATEPAFRFRA